MAHTTDTREKVESRERKEEAPVQKAGQRPSGEAHEGGKEGQGAHQVEVRRQGGPWVPRPSVATPFGMFRRFFDEVDQLFGEFGFRPMRAARDALAPAGRLLEGIWAPDVEVFEREGKLVVRADLPGLRREDVKVEIRDNELVLEGERREEHEERREGFYQSEVSYGRFYRSIPLPEGVDSSDAAAKFRDGVLEIEMKLPERPQEKVRRVEIR